MGRENPKTCLTCSMHKSYAKDFVRSSSDILPDYGMSLPMLFHHLFSDETSKYWYIDPLYIELKEYPVHCSYPEAKTDGLPWYFDIKKYLESEIYPADDTSSQRNSISHMELNFFLSGEVFYRRTPCLGLLRCVNVIEVAMLIKHIHAGVCGTHINGLTLARKILRAGYFLMTIDYDC